MIDDEWEATGAVRAVRVHGPRAPLVRDARWSYWDARGRTLWLLDESGHAQGTCVDELSPVERALASAEERVTEARFLPGTPLRLALVLLRPSSGLARVVIANLEDGTLVDLIKPRMNAPELIASLDGSAVLVSSPWTSGVYSRWAVDGTTSDDVSAEAAFEEGALDWALLDRSRVWVAHREGIIETSLDDRTKREWVLRFERDATECALVSNAGSEVLALLTRDAQRARARFVRSDGTLWFEQDFEWGSSFVLVTDEGVVVRDALQTYWLLAPSGAREALDVRGWLFAGTASHWLACPSQELVLIARAAKAQTTQSEARAVTTLALSANGARVVCCEAGERLRAYRTTDGGIEAELVLRAERQMHWVAGMCEGDRAAAIVQRNVGDRTVSLWRIDEREAALAELFSIERSTRPALVYAVSSDGSRALVLRDSDETALLSRRSDEPRERVIAALNGLERRPAYAVFCDDDRAIDVLSDERSMRYGIADDELVRDEPRAVPNDFTALAALGRVRVEAVAERKNNDAPKLHLAGPSGREAWSERALLRKRVVALASAREVERVAAAIAPSMLFIVLDGEGKEIGRVSRKQSTADTVNAMALSDDGRVLVAGTASGQRVVIELE
ncbi:MAG: hypothetical protein U0269_21770 [Polyangiales bacterium]